MKINYRRYLHILAKALVVAACVLVLQPRIAQASWWHDPDFRPSGSTGNMALTVYPEESEYTSDRTYDVKYQVTQTVEEMKSDSGYGFAWWQYTLNGITVTAKETTDAHSVDFEGGKPTLVIYDVDPVDVTDVYAVLSGNVIVSVEPEEGGTAKVTAPEAYPEAGWYPFPIEMGASVLKYKATPNKGYKLKEWVAVQPKNMLINPNTTATEVTTAIFPRTEVKAIFELAEYTLTVTDDGNGTAQADKTSGLHYEDTVMLTATPSAGYTFDHWEVVNPKDVTIAGDTLTMPDSDVEVKAIFVKDAEPELATFTIDFKGNGGKGSMDSLTVKEGDSTKLTANAFKRSGYTFVGWNTEKDGSGDAYDNKEKVSPDGDLTLYAQWEKNESNPPAKKPAKPAQKKIVRRLPQTGDPLSLATCVGTALAGASLLLAGRRMRKH